MPRAQTRLEEYTPELELPPRRGGATRPNSHRGSLRQAALSVRRAVDGTTLRHDARQPLRVDGCEHLVPNERLPCHETADALTAARDMKQTLY